VDIQGQTLARSPRAVIPKPEAKNRYRAAKLENVYWWWHHPLSGHGIGRFVPW